jgi:hypothetical protein
MEEIASYQLVQLLATLSPTSAVHGIRMGRFASSLGTQRFLSRACVTSGWRVYSGEGLHLRGRLRGCEIAWPSSWFQMRRALMYGCCRSWRPRWKSQPCNILYRGSTRLSGAPSTPRREDTGRGEHGAEPGVELTFLLATLMSLRLSSRRRFDKHLCLVRFPFFR